MFKIVACCVDHDVNDLISVYRYILYAVHFKHSFNQRPERFSNASKALMGDKNTERGEVINYTLDDVSIHPVTTKIQAYPANTAHLPEGKETTQGFHHEANVDFTSV
jgi:hypothetical protein